MNATGSSHLPSPAEAALLARRALIERQLKALLARQNDQRRKALNRAKFVLGTAALERARTDPGWFAELCAALSPRERQAVQGALAGQRSAEAQGQQSILATRCRLPTHVHCP